MFLALNYQQLIIQSTIKIMLVCEWNVLERWNFDFLIALRNVMFYAY